MSELFLYRLDSGETLLHFRASDDVTAVNLVRTGHPPQPLTDFINDPWDGARVYQTVLTFTGPFTVVASRPPQPDEIFSATSLNAIYDIPPDKRNWNLPPWLPYGNRIKQIFDAASFALPGELVDSVDPRTAPPLLLQQHAVQFGVQAFPGESYESLQARILALASGKYTTREALEAHLRAICGCPVSISDGFTSAIPASRMGPPLDGTRNLGGHDSGIQRYRVRLPRRPLITYGELRQELERVRPSGFRYELFVSRRRSIAALAPCGEQVFILRLGDGGYDSATFSVVVPNPAGLHSPIVGLEAPCQYTFDEGIVGVRAVFEPWSTPRRVTEAALFTSSNELIYSETFRPLWLEAGMRLEFIYEFSESAAGGVEVYQRPGEHVGYAPEIVKSPGPIALGAPGLEYSQLFHTPYVAIKAQGQVILYRSSSNGYVFEQVLPTNHANFRHIALAFDQSAQYVLAYEVLGSPPQIYVRQYDAVTDQYVYRGPFPGCDPVLLNDAVILHTTDESDVLLLYLSPDRRTLAMRAQRDQFAVEYVLETFPDPVTLDSASLLAYQWQAEGYGLNVRSELYPAHVKNSLDPITLRPPLLWDYGVIVITELLRDDILDTMLFSAALDWDYIPLVVTRTLSDDSLDSTSINPPVNWDYSPIVMIRTLSDDSLDSTSINPPVNWDYIPLVVTRTLSDDSLDSTSINPPVNWSYSVIVVILTMADDALDNISVAPPLEWSYTLP